MPELPEVQTIVNDLKSADLIGATITRARIFWPRIISGLEPHLFCKRIKNRILANVWRRAKYIIFDFSQGGHLLIHLRMSGRLHLAESNQNRSKHDHVILNFEDQRQLRFHDTRKFGRFYLVDNFEAVVGHLGPEPLDPAFNANFLTERLRSRKRLLKPLLLDQTFIAGLGNIYVDEALWEAGIHPRRISNSLLKPEIKALHKAITKVLKRGLKNFGTTLGNGKPNFHSIRLSRGYNQNELMVFRRSNLPCPRCNTTIERILVGQRGTHICPACQKI
ncbi:MAG: DNA-formamidopyrimidine glycosylase [Desulfobacterales bacterium]|nr:DNA-formamidopyrimidine glycosylase [Desulfobacterales bacterium]